MVSIVDSEYSSPHLSQLENWFAGQWGDEEYFKTTRAGYDIPAPLLAIENEQLCGGLSFTRFKNPDKDEMALWVNGVFVPAEFRGKSIASELIMAATELAVGFNKSQLFALTNVPTLYVKLGWKIIDTEGNDKVVMWHCKTRDV